MTQILRQSTQVVVRIGPFVDVGDGFTPETGVTLSGADEAEALRAAGAATLDISAATWAAVTGADGWYDLTLSTTATNTVGTLDIVVNDDSVCLPVFARFQVIEEAAYDTIYAASALPASTTNITAGTVTTATNVTTVNGLAAGVITAAAIATGAIDADAIADGAIDAGAFAAGAITATVIANGAIDAATFAAGAIDAAALAADAGTEIGTAVWATTTRALTILDEDSTTLDLDTTIRAAVGLAGADLDTQLAALPTAAENADAVWDEDATGHQTGGTFGQAIGDPGADTNTIFKATVTDATGVTVGTDTATLLTRMGTPSDLGGGATVAQNLSDIEAQTDDIGVAGAGLTALATQASVDDLPTNAELATALGTADDAVLTAIGDLPTNAELATALGTADDAVLAQIALVKAKTDSLTYTVAGVLDTNVQYVNDVAVTGTGAAGDEWGP